MVECRRRSESQQFSDKSSVEISFNFLLSQFLCVVCVNVPTQMFTHRNGDGESRKVSNACWLFYVCACSCPLGFEGGFPSSHAGYLLSKSNNGRYYYF